MNDTKTMASNPPGPAARSGKLGRAIAVMGGVGWAAHAVAICLLSYFVSVRLVDATGVLLYRMGLVWFDAAIAASMAGFVYWLVILLWAFSRRGVWRARGSMGVLTALAMLAF